MQCLIGGAIGVAIGFGCALALRELTVFPRLGADVGGDRWAWSSARSSACFSESIRR